MNRRIRLFTLLFLGLAACIDGAPTEPGPAGITLLLVSGNEQEATAGTELPQPLVVRAVGTNGRVLRNQVINFHVTEGGGSVFAGAANTNQHGVAREYWTLGPVPGRNVLEVRAVDPSSGEKQVFATFVATGLPVPVASVTVDPAEAVVAELEELQLDLVLHDASGNELTDEREVVWTSSDEAIATVTPAGVVKGVSAGPVVTITATVEGRSGQASITVIPAPVASVEVTPDAATLDIGETVQLNAVLRDVRGNELSDRPITWTSSDEDVATVSASGLVTAEAGGSVVINASSEGKVGSTDITVRFPSTPTDVVSSITVTPESVTLGVGESVTLTATLFDAAGLRVTGSHVVSWSASGPSVAFSTQNTVAIDGVTTVQLVAASAGQTTVTAAVAAVSRSVSVTVLGPDAYEPNDVGSAAASIGSANDDGPAVSVSATIHTTTDQDWYRVRAVERSSAVCFPGSTQGFRLTVRLSDIPSGLDYDLEVRVDSPTGTRFTSTAGGNTSELLHIDYSGTCGADDSRDFYIRVYRYSGAQGDPSGQQYDLEATFRRR